MTLVKDGKADFIQVDYFSGVLQQGREIGLNLKYKEKWEFVAKKQDQAKAVDGWKITKRKYQG